MVDDRIPALSESNALEIKSQLSKTGSSRRERLTMKFLMAAIGSIPWVGGFLSAAASIPGDERDARADDLRTRWLEEHQIKFENLRATFEEISERFDALGAAIDQRLQAPEYLALVRQSFRTWDSAETAEKRKYVSNLITNAAGTSICSDDVIRLFIDWLDVYHEAHFSVIREVFQNPGSTRYEIWTRVNGELPREDSAEADLFKLLIRDLSTGGVIRQARETTSDGQFLKNRSSRRRGHASTTLESAFEDTKSYELTELGRQFVHYTMNEIVRRIDSKPATDTPQ